MSRTLREIKQNNIDVAEAVAEYFNIDLGGWSAREKKMAGAFIIQQAALRISNEGIGL